MSDIRILIADDHGIVRAGLRLLLEGNPGMSVAGEAADGQEAVRLSEELKPDVVLMDIAMPVWNGIDATAQIVRKNRAIAVIILSMHSDESYLLRALTAGARGYLLKDSADEFVVDAIRDVHRGRPYFSPPISAMLQDDYVQQLQRRKLQDSYDLLTEREKQILQALAEGRSNKEVAALLGLSPLTVETHRTNLMQKLNLHSTAEIVLYAVRKKIIS